MDRNTSINISTGRVPDGLNAPLVNERSNVSFGTQHLTQDVALGNDSSIFFESMAHCLLQTATDGDSGGVSFENFGQPSGYRLHQAAKIGRVSLVKKLLRYDSNIEETDRYQQTPLHHAARKGHLTVVQVLLKAGAICSKADKLKRTPIHYAAKKGHLEVVQALLASRADVNKVDIHDRGPLHYAAKKGHLEVVQALLASGADVNKVDIHDRDPLHYAAKKGHLLVTKALLASGADDVDRVDCLGMTLLHHTAESGKQDVVRALLEAGANINIVDSSGRTPLYCASSKGHSEVVMLLRMEARINVNQANTLRQSPLHIAVSRGHLNVLEVLLPVNSLVRNILSFFWNLKIFKGVSSQALQRPGVVDVNCTNQIGQTPLNYAAANGNLAIVKHLLASGANVNFADNHGWLPLHWVARLGHLNVAKELLKARADVNTTNEIGETPLFLAAGHGHLEVVQALLQAGANFNATNRKGETPLFLAAGQGHLEVVQHLLQAGADVNAKDYYGRNSLHYAVMRDNLPIVQTIVQARGCVTQIDCYGNSPLSIAYSNNSEIFTFMLESAAAPISRYHISRNENIRAGVHENAFKESYWRNSFGEEYVEVGFLSNFLSSLQRCCASTGGGRIVRDIENVLSCVKEHPELGKDLLCHINGFGISCQDNASHRFRGMVLRCLLFEKKLKLQNGINDLTEIIHIFQTLFRRERLQKFVSDYLRKHPSRIGEEVEVYLYVDSELHNLLKFTGEVPEIYYRTIGHVGKKVISNAANSILEYENINKNGLRDFVLQHDIWVDSMKKRLEQPLQEIYNRHMDLLAEIEKRAGFLQTSPNDDCSQSSVNTGEYITESVHLKFQYTLAEESLIREETEIVLRNFREDLLR